jgi:hypothetical protein
VDVQINEMTSNVKVGDSQALLDSRVIERVIEIVIRRVREETTLDQRRRNESVVRPGASAEAQQNWD